MSPLGCCIARFVSSLWVQVARPCPILCADEVLFDDKEGKSIFGKIQNILSHTTRILGMYCGGFMFIDITIQNSDFSVLSQ